MHSALQKSPSAGSYKVPLCACTAWPLANDAQENPMHPTSVLFKASFSPVSWLPNLRNFGSSVLRTQMTTSVKQDHRPLPWLLFPIRISENLMCFPFFQGSWLYCPLMSQISCHIYFVRFHSSLLWYGKLFHYSVMVEREVDIPS